MRLSEAIGFISFNSVADVPIQNRVVFIPPFPFLIVKLRPFLRHGSRMALGVLSSSAVNASAEGRIPLVLTNHQRHLIFEIFARIVVALFNIAFAANLLTDIIQFRRASSIMALALTVTAVTCILCRRISIQSNFAVYDWFVALYGTLLPMSMRTAYSGADSPILTLLQATGSIMAIAGILSLNRSFGIVAGNRGVQTFGLYRYVRHPIYAGYFLCIGAACALNLTLWNAVIFILWVIFQVLRIRAEERHLMKDSKYVDYTQRVRWRILPFVF
jgi:protein-S-isoprenylcysteine O-methyltransferase Ste14